MAALTHAGGTPPWAAGLDASSTRSFHTGGASIWPSPVPVNPCEPVPIQHLGRAMHGLSRRPCRRDTGRFVGARHEPSADREPRERELDGVGGGGEDRKSA